MNTVIKTLCLTLSLCAASVYAGEQVGEHKGSESSRSKSTSSSLISVHSRDLSLSVESYEFDVEAMKKVDELGLTKEELAYYRANKPASAQVIFGVDKFTQDGEGNPIVQAKKRSFFARVCCFCCK